MDCFNHMGTFPFLDVNFYFDFIFLANEEPVSVTDVLISNKTMNSDRDKGREIKRSNTTGDYSQRLKLFIFYFNF